MALGQKLVAELKLVESPDTLARWMAHYVAELIHTADSVPPDDATDARSRCSSAILELWDHRASLPDRARPYESLEPIVLTLARLDPDKPSLFYRPSMWGELSQLKIDDDKLSSLLKLIVDVDKFARMVITDTLSAATEIAARESGEWASLAQAAETKDLATEVVMRIIEASQARESPGAQERERLSRKIERLDALISLATAHKEDIERERSALEGL
jgi:hypothetical protein